MPPLVPGLEALISKLRSQADAMEKIGDLVQQANLDPAAQQQLLTEARAAGAAAGIPGRCLPDPTPPPKVASSTPPPKAIASSGSSTPPPTQAANTGASSNPPAVCTKPTWICSYKDSSTGKMVNSLAPPVNVANCPYACIASDGSIASYMWVGLAGSGSSSPPSFNGRPVVQANSTAGAPGTQGGCPNGQRNGNFYNVGGGGTYGCMCPSGDWVAYGRSCSDNSSSAHSAAVGVDAPIVPPPTYAPAASPPTASASPAPSSPTSALSSPYVQPLTAGTASGIKLSPNPFLSGTNSGTSRAPGSGTPATPPTASSPTTATPPPATVTQGVAYGSCSTSGGVQTCEQNGKVISTTKTSTNSPTSSSSQPTSTSASTTRSASTTQSGQQRTTSSAQTTTSRSSSYSRSVGGRSASATTSQATARSASFRSTGAGQRWSGGGGYGGGRHLSDIRLKEYIVPLGRLDNGIGVYRFRYRGNDHTRYVGVMAQEVQIIAPNAVSRRRDGYLVVDYDMLGLKFLTWDEWVVRGSTQSRTVQ